MYDKEVKISDKLIRGYQYFCDTNHPLSNTSGYVYYHRHVASLKIGRWLLSEEVVHHIDGNKTNNSPENLEVLSREEHGRLEQNKIGNYKEEIKCSKCEKVTWLTDKKVQGRIPLCRECTNLSKRVFNPTKEELYNLVWEYPTTKVAEIYGVTDKAIEKRCKIMGIS